MENTNRNKSAKDKLEEMMYSAMLRKIYYNFKAGSTTSDKITQEERTQLKNKGELYNALFDIMNSLYTELDRDDLNGLMKTKINDYDEGLLVSYELDDGKSVKKLLKLI